MGLFARLFVGMRISDASATVAGLLVRHWSAEFPGNPRDLAGQLVSSVCGSDPSLVSGDMPLPSRHGLAATALAAGLGSSSAFPSLEWQVVPIRSALRDLLGSPAALSPSKAVDSLLFLKASSVLSAG